MIPEQLEFVEASHTSATYLHAGIAPAVRAVTLKYNCVFFGIQAFALAMACSGSAVAGLMAFQIVYMVTSAFYTVCVSVLTCYIRDTAYLHTLDASLAAQIQHKIGVKDTHV